MPIKGVTFTETMCSDAKYVMILEFKRKQAEWTIKRNMEECKRDNEKNGIIREY